MTHPQQARVIALAHHRTNRRCCGSRGRWGARDIQGQHARPDESGPHAGPAAGFGARRTVERGRRSLAGTPRTRRWSGATKDRMANSDRPWDRRADIDDQPAGYRPQRGVQRRDTEWSRRVDSGIRGPGRAAEWIGWGGAARGGIARAELAPSGTVWLALRDRWRRRAARIEGGAALVRWSGEPS